MKKIKYLLFAICISLVGSLTVNAANASINVSASTKKAIVGNKVKVKVTVSSSDLGAWEYCISYDSSVLKLTSSTADANTCVKTGYVTSTSQKSSTETFTFKVLKSGSSKVGVKSYAVYSYSSEQQMPTSAGSVTINTMTQSELEATYSKNAYLKSLSVSNVTLTPEFSKETYTYNGEVENEVESVTVNATKEDANASVSGAGNVALTEGNNKIEVKVTAQKGNSLTYTINIYRKELDPIKLKYKNDEYTVVRKADELAQLKNYGLSTITMEDKEVPCLKSEITGYTLIGLKDDDGNIKMYIYDNDVIAEYKEVVLNTLTIYPQELPDSKKFAKYKVKEINFNGEKIKAYVLNDDSKYAIIYGQNVETGDIKYYIYDSEENTVITYTEELDKYYQNKTKIYKFLVLGLTGLSVLLLCLLFIKKPKNKVKNLSEKEE